MKLKINPRVVIVREAVNRIVQILVGKGIKVRQAGSKAYVAWNPDGSVGYVNLPYLPDDAEDELIIAVQGFLDHEVAHILFTDPKASFEARKLKVHGLWNRLEDPFIEGCMAKRFTGSAYNMRAAATLYLTSRIEKDLPNHPESALNLLMVPAFRAWSGQQQFVDFMKDKWQLIEEFTKTVGQDMIDKMPQIESSWDTLEIVKEIQKRLIAADKREKEEKPSKDAPSPPSQDEDEDDDMRSEDGAGPAPDDDLEWEDQEPQGGGGKPDEDESQEEAGDEEGEEGKPGSSSKDKEEANGADDEDSGKPEKPDGDGDGDGSSPDAADEGDESDGDSDAQDDDGEGSSGTGTEDDGAEDDADDSDRSVGGRADADSEEDVEDSDKEGSEEDSGGDEQGDVEGGKEPECYEPGMGAEEFERIMNDSEDYDDAVARSISEKMGKTHSPYLIYSRDYDKIETFDAEDCPAHYVSSLEDEVDHMIAPMQKDLERAMAARSATVWTGGHKRGRLHGAALVRLIAGNRDDVFRRKQDNVSKSVAVSLVNDCSGSMTEDGKISLAMHAAYGLSATLERIGITHEVIGFTTTSLPYNVLVEMQADPNYKRYARAEGIYMPVFKEFGERLTANVKRRFAMVAHQRGPFVMNSNVDGESIQNAAHRLAMRPEKRKVMIVLSDGMPACGSPCGGAVLDDHLVEVVKSIEKSGINVVGIGINATAVNKFYPKRTIITNIKQLPAEVMKQLKALLVQ